MPASFKFFVWQISPTQNLTISVWYPFMLPVVKRRRQTLRSRKPLFSLKKNQTLKTKNPLCTFSPAITRVRNSSLDLTLVISTSARNATGAKEAMCRQNKQNQRGGKSETLLLRQMNT